MTTGLNDPKITKDDTPVDGSGILAQFQSQVTDFVNAQSKWNLSGTNNFLGNFPLGGYALYSTNFGGSAPLKAGETISNAPDSTSLPNVKVLASEVETALRNAVVVLSNAREFHLRKYYYNSVWTPVLWADFGVQLGHLTDTYRLALGSVSTGLATETPVDASDLDGYVTTLDGELTSHRTNTLDFNEYWCHSACHSSHSSRNRR
jgi:hypothetical protein